MMAKNIFVKRIFTIFVVFARNCKFVNLTFVNGPKKFHHEFFLGGVPTKSLRRFQNMYGLTDFFVLKDHIQIGSFFAVTHDINLA